MSNNRIFHVSFPLLDKKLFSPGHLDVFALHPSDMLEDRAGYVERYSPGHGRPDATVTEINIQKKLWSIELNIPPLVGLFYGLNRL